MTIHRRGMRYLHDLRKDANANVVLNQLKQAYTASGYLWRDHAVSGGCKRKPSAEGIDTLLKCLTLSHIRKML